jgi:hypothetical protein
MVKIAKAEAGKTIRERAGRVLWTASKILNFALKTRRVISGSVGLNRRMVRDFMRVWKL